MDIFLRDDLLKEQIDFLSQKYNNKTLLLNITDFSLLFAINPILFPIIYQDLVFLSQFKPQITFVVAWDIPILRTIKIKHTNSTDRLAITHHFSSNPHFIRFDTSSQLGDIKDIMFFFSKPNE